MPDFAVSDGVYSRRVNGPSTSSMKRFRHLFAASALALVAISNLNAVADDSFLLRTQWHQDGPFAQFTPNRVRVGCLRRSAYATHFRRHMVKVPPTSAIRHVRDEGFTPDSNTVKTKWNSGFQVVPLLATRVAAGQSHRCPKTAGMRLPSRLNSAPLKPAHLSQRVPGFLACAKASAPVALRPKQ
jgi:hypothetical protein